VFCSEPVEGGETGVLMAGLRWNARFKSPADPEQTAATRKNVASRLPVPDWVAAHPVKRTAPM
jgi:hypothetical protein